MGKPNYSFEKHQKDMAKKKKKEEKLQRRSEKTTEPGDTGSDIAKGTDATGIETTQD